jgi:patatin-like phospholipase/acyl hydrolase
MNEMRTDVVATAINTKTNELRTFSRDTDGIVPLWEVARASSAAPTKFKAYEINGIPYIDGGIGENNPVLRLLMRMRELSQQRKQSFNLDTATVLSLGTGEMPVDSVPNDAGLSSAGRIIDACMSVQSNAAEKTAKSLVKNFVSINPKLSEMIALDRLDDDTRAHLREAAETKYEDIEEFAHLDVVQRQLGNYSTRPKIEV